MVTLHRIHICYTTEPLPFDFWRADSRELHAVGVVAMVITHSQRSGRPVLIDVTNIRIILTVFFIQQLSECFILIAKRDLAPYEIRPRWRGFSVLSFYILGYLHFCAALKACKKDCLCTHREKLRLLRTS